MLRQHYHENEQRTPLLTEEPKPIEHPVKFFEKGDKPLELIMTKQWFVRLLDKIGALLDAGNRISWHPEFMRTRYQNWTENLQLDWCISRQRFFGVSFPVWFRVDHHGNADSSQLMLATDDQLPVDPMNTPPPGFDESQRDQPGGFTAETDVFDTWFTSSLSPQIVSRWHLDPERHKRLFPNDLRPQSHEIIRTWAFYTIVKSLLHEHTLPWEHIAISGWILDPERKKMSKSKGNVVTPMHLIDEYSADAVRYWAGGARLGVDTAFDENILKVGKRFVTKIFNASKFVLSQGGQQSAVVNELDRAFIQRLRTLVARVSELHEKFDYATALKETESFFWNSFTDTYIELVKARARREGADASGRGSAVATLRLGLSVLLRLFAPVLPYVTEEVWSWVFAKETGSKSIHRASWPRESEFVEIEAPVLAASFDLAITYLNTINRSRAEAGVSTGRPFEKLVVAANRNTVSRLDPIVSDVMGAARAQVYEIKTNEDLNDDFFEVLEARFTPSS
jgi:valyl-tRNA synthetase